MEIYLIWAGGHGLIIANQSRLQTITAIEAMDWRLLDFQFVPVGRATLDTLAPDAGSGRG